MKRKMMIMMYERDKGSWKWVDYSKTKGAAECENYWKVRYT